MFAILIKIQARRGTKQFQLLCMCARFFIANMPAFECTCRYNLKLWKAFNMVFNCLPIAAIVDDKIFCIHGGLSPDLNSMEQIRRYDIRFLPILEHRSA